MNFDPNQLPSIPEIPPAMIEAAFPGGFNLRDEANALVAFAFRNGMLEDLHSGKHSKLLEDASLSRISDEEMKNLVIEASRKLAIFLTLRERDPERYSQVIRGYGMIFCSNWER